MKLFLCLVTPDEALRRFFGRGKDIVIPAQALQRGPYASLTPQVATVAWVPKTPVSSGDLERFVLRRARDTEACIMFVDRRWEYLATEMRNAAFVMPFDPYGAAENPKNFFNHLAARSLKGFGQIYARFQKSEDARLLALPLRNFQSAPLLEIASLCRDIPGEPALGDAVESQLIRLRGCVRPRKHTSYNTRYAVDEAGRFFVYGHERHAQFDTGEPHVPSCEVAGLFRFGVRLDERRHYNVSETEGDKTQISGSFPDCHGSLQDVKRHSHLNMFSNDFF